MAGRLKRRASANIVSIFHGADQILPHFRELCRVGDETL